jgi:25S rRNA (uracil2634-N3)-methyltransferase
MAKLKNKVNSKGLVGALARQALKEQERRRLAHRAAAREEHSAQKQQSMTQGRGRKKAQHHHKGLQPFGADDKVMLVGEGDFLYARALVEQHYVQAGNLVATSLDGEAELAAKYPETAAANVAALRGAGVDVRFGIDATRLCEDLKLKRTARGGRDGQPRGGQPGLFKDNKKLDYIAFNFPHTGRGMKDQDRNIRDHQRLVVAYMRSCRQVFGAVNCQRGDAFGGYNYGGRDDRVSGRVVLLVFEGEPYRLWGVKALARSEGLRLEQLGALAWSAYPGYHHRRTNGVRDTTKPAPEREARIYVFEDARGAEKEPKPKATTDDE